MSAVGERNNIPRFFNLYALYFLYNQFLCCIFFVLKTFGHTQNTQRSAKREPKQRQLLDIQMQTRGVAETRACGAAMESQLKS